MQDERWRIALYEPQHANLAIDGLYRIGIPSYHPILWARGGAGGHGAKRQRPQPMFPGYLFVKFSLDLPLWQHIFHTPGLRKRALLMDASSTYSEVPEDMIEAISLKEQQENGKRNALCERMGLKIGDNVRIKVGKWADILANVQALDDDERIILLINMLGREHRVEARADEVVPAA